MKAGCLPDCPTARLAEAWPLSATRAKPEIQLFCLLEPQRASPAEGDYAGITGLATSWLAAFQTPSSGLQKSSCGGEWRRLFMLKLQRLGVLQVSTRW